MPAASNILQNPLLLRKRLVRIDIAAELRESEDAARRSLKGKEVPLGKRNIAYRLEDVLQLAPDDVLDPRIEELLSQPADGRGSQLRLNAPVERLITRQVSDAERPKAIPKT